MSEDLKMFLDSRAVASVKIREMYESLSRRLKRLDTPSWFVLAWTCDINKAAT